MKTTAAIVIIAALLISCAAKTGFVGFHYPKIIQNEPLRHPQKVVRLDGTNIFLENGTVIAVETLDASEISNVLRQSEAEIDVQPTNGELIIWARKDGWVCGTPWAQTIRIPLFADTTYVNRREMIAIGTVTELKANASGSSRASNPIPPSAVQEPAASGTLKSGNPYP